MRKFKGQVAEAQKRTPSAAQMDPLEDHHEARQATMLAENSQYVPVPWGESFKIPTREMGPDLRIFCSFEKQFIESSHVMEPKPRNSATSEHELAASYLARMLKSGRWEEPRKDRRARIDLTLRNFVVLNFPY